MRVELLYFKDCPSWEVAYTRVGEALRSIGRHDIAVDLRLVETTEQATKLKFIGSPTIRIDGADPFAAGDEPVGLACRLYDTPVGRAGSPTAAQLVGVLS